VAPELAQQIERCGSISVDTAIFDDPFEEEWLPLGAADSYDERYARMREHQKRRYHNDPEFRSRVAEYQRAYRRRKNEEA
jgi:hypothetical protein